jgi:hypothetical protein
MMLVGLHAITAVLAVLNAFLFDDVTHTANLLSVILLLVHI